MGKKQCFQPNCTNVWKDHISVEEYYNGVWKNVDGFDCYSCKQHHYRLMVLTGGFYGKKSKFILVDKERVCSLTSVFFKKIRILSIVLQK